MSATQKLREVERDLQRSLDIVDKVKREIQFIQKDHPMEYKVRETIRGELEIEAGHAAIHLLAGGLESEGIKVKKDPEFDTLYVPLK